MNSGEITKEDFLADLHGQIQKNIENIRKMTPGKKLGGTEGIGNCPKCGKPVMEGKKNWYCPGYSLPMAITKIFPIKKTLHKAIKYIVNPQKTDGSTLLAAYQCGVYTADLEMEIIAKQGKGSTRKNDRKAYHIIQSFSKDDPVTPEQALKIGRQLAWKYTGGNHQFIVATHVDKGHIHNHIIFNATDYTSYGKIHIQNKNLDRLRGISDRLCEENGLSVIEEKSGIRGRGKYEHEQHQEGNSWKDKLRDAIDRTILAAEDFDDFITRMEMEEGYEIKTGKYISFRGEGQERFTRNKRLGENYSIEAICERIENKDKVPRRETAKKTAVRKSAPNGKKKIEKKTPDTFI